MANTNTDSNAQWTWESTVADRHILQERGVMIGTIDGGGYWISRRGGDWVTRRFADTLLDAICLGYSMPDLGEVANG